MLFAVIFKSKKEELIICAIEARNEEEAIEKVLKPFEEEHEEGINWNHPPEAVQIIPGEGIYWGPKHD